MPELQNVKLCGLRYTHPAHYHDHYYCLGYPT